MANKNNLKGYSDALGGFGVPHQVEATGGSNTGPSGGGAPAVKLNKSLLLIIIVAAAAAAVIITLFATGIMGGGYKDAFTGTETSQQGNEGGAVTTVYMPQLADNIDWDNLSDNERESMAKYSIKNTVEAADAAGVNMYIIMGQKQGTPIFYYYKGQGVYYVSVKGTTKELPYQ
jgi:hypothetical protein